MSKYSRDLKKKKMVKEAIENNMDPKKMTREGFMKYLEENVNFISILRCTDGTVFMDMCGWDGGDLKQNKIEDGPRYTQTKEVDKYIKMAADTFKEYGAEVPKVSFTEFCLKSTDKI